MSDDAFKDKDDELPSGLWEELRVMDERAAQEPHLTAETFQRPTSELCRRPVETLDVSATVGDCVDMMQAAKFGAVVITAEGKLAGILTERDVLTKALAQSPTGWRDLPAEKIMTARPDSLRPEDPMVYVMNRMYAGAYRHVPVVNDANEPTHIVSIRDVLHFMLDHFEPEVSNIPPEPFRGPPKQWGG